MLIPAEGFPWRSQCFLFIKLCYFQFWSPDLLPCAMEGQQAKQGLSTKWQWELLWVQPADLHTIISKVNFDDNVQLLGVSVLKIMCRCTAEERWESELKFPLQTSPQKWTGLWGSKLSDSNPSWQEQEGLARLEVKGTDGRCSWPTEGYMHTENIVQFWVNVH